MAGNRLLKIVVLIFVGTILVFAGLGLVQLFNNIRYGSSIIIEVAPTDATVTINGNKAKIGKNLANSGTYQIGASREGFEPYTKTIKVGNDEDAYAGLVLYPKESEFSNWYLDNRSEAENAESISGKNSDIVATQNKQNSPLITRLPAIYRPFSIDYGKSKKYPNDPGKIAIYIKALNPADRQSALRWIENRGFNPADYEIVFSNYRNPFMEVE